MEKGRIHLITIPSYVDHLRMTMKAEQVKLLGGGEGEAGRRRITKLRYAVVW
jgi:hypothetical protein